MCFPTKNIRAMVILLMAAASVQAETQPGESREFDGIQFVWLAAGEFRMGSISLRSMADERLLTRVRISRGFWMGKYEVTQGQWETVMGSNPSGFDECGSDCPVDSVSWDDVQEFVGKMNATAGEKRYRLPTEAEWEYAARAGTSEDTYAGNLTSSFGQDRAFEKIAWYDDNSGDRPHPVGGKAPNAWGLYDMLGNVLEWVGDRDGNYPGGSVTDPRGPASGWTRVYRGGSWLAGATFSRVSRRYGHFPDHRDNDLGFRLLRTE